MCLWPCCRESVISTRCRTEREWSSLRPIYCCFLYFHADGQVHWLSSPEGTYHKCIDSGNLAVPTFPIGGRYLGHWRFGPVCHCWRCCVFGLALELGWDCFLCASHYARMVADVPDLDLDSKGNWDLSEIPLSSIIDVCPCLPATTHWLEKGATLSQLPVHLTPGTNFHGRYTAWTMWMRNASSYSLLMIHVLICVKRPCACSHLSVKMWCILRSCFDVWRDKLNRRTCRDRLASVGRRSVGFPCCEG